MILVDAGPLVALIDRDEKDHRKCLEAFATLSAPMVTTWPAFTEAMYLVGEAGGWSGQQALWRMVERADLQLASLDDDQCRRSRALMEKYRDAPMDLARATLVALAETLDQLRIFTLDREFGIDRGASGRHFAESRTYRWNVSWFRTAPRNAE